MLCFALGWATLVVALASPLHALADRAFFAHMLVHLLLMTVAAPLLVLARPLAPLAWALPGPARAGLLRPVLALARSLGDPFVATGVQVAVLSAWHLPALFELAVDVMKRADPTDSEAVIAAIAASNIETIVGKVAWDGANLPPFAGKNVAKTPLVGGQWRLKDGGGYDLVIVDNQTAPNIPTGGKMEAIG